MRTPRVSRRWLVPGTAIGLVAGAGLLGPVVADASPELPDIAPEQLLVRVQTARVDGLSGTVRTSLDLGLPALPSASQGGGHQPNLLSGKHTLRIALAEPDKARVAVLDEMAERVFSTDGRTAWTYNSNTREASRYTLPERKARKKAPGWDPQAVAKQFLAAVDPSTRVEVTGTESVAGRDAYLLRLTPRTDRTLVGSITVAVDAREWIPLRVTVRPRSGGEPAIDVGFTDVSFAVPPASTFAFTPPKGTEITENQGGPADFALGIGHSGLGAAQGFSWAFGAEPPTLVGTGWEAVAVTKWFEDETLEPLLANARQVPGGRVLSSRLVQALFLDDGRVAVGMVPTSVLQAAAAKAPR